MAYSSPAKLDARVKDILVDPIGRFPLRWTPTEPFPITVRRMDSSREDRFSKPTRTWKLGQIAFEQWEKRVAKEVERDYTSEPGGVREIYEVMPLSGRCLDVGGHQVRAFLKPGQEYLIVDPFLDAFEGIES